MPGQKTQKELICSRDLLKLCYLVAALPFHELELEEQIRNSSVIALAKYEPSADGKMEAIIKEFLKNEPGAVIYYGLCDEHPSSSYCPKANTNYGDGLVISLAGSPATRLTSTELRRSAAFHMVHSLVR